MRLLHISLNTTHSECKPSSSISSFTHSLQVFLLLPAHLTPATITFLQADTQSLLLRSTCPNHLNLPCLTTSATLSATEDCTNHHCASYPSATPRTTISPSSVPYSHFLCMGESELSAANACGLADRSFEFGFIILQSTADMPRGLMAFEEFFKILTSYKPGKNT